MKYKVGDKVKIVNNILDTNLEKGEIVKIISVDKDDKIRTYRVKAEFGDCWVNELDIVYAEYTWEMFENCPIGTKVTFESGKYIFKDDKDLFENKNDSLNYNDLKNFKDNFSGNGKIIKIEEPTYTIVYEPKETMPEIEEMKRLTDELCKTCDEFIKKIKEK